MSERVDARDIWQSQPAEGTVLSTDALREKGDTLLWETRRRGKTGYWWAAYFTLVFGWNIVGARNGLEIAGNTLCIAGAFFMAERWRRYAADRGLREDVPVMAFLAAYRAELARQKRLARRAGIMSLLPLVVGMLMAATGHLAARQTLHAGSIAMLVGFAALVLGFAWIMSALAAQQVQFRIDEVDAALRARG